MAKVPQSKEEIADLKRLTMHSAESDADVEEYGPLFRRRWRKTETPLCILGSAVRNGTLFHLVRLKSSEGDEELLAGGEKNPKDGIDDTNCIFICSETMSEEFPDLVIKYYQDNSKLTDNGKTPEDVEEGAARAGLFQQLRENKVKVDGAPIFNDMMGTNDHGHDKYYLDAGINAEEEEESDDGKDKFGLPEDYGSGASGSENSESSSGNEEVVEVEEEEELKPRKKKAK